MKLNMFTKKQRNVLYRIIISLILFIVVLTVDKVISLEKISKLNWVLPFICYFIIYVIIAYDILYKAFKNIIRGKIFDENFLMCIASIGAFLLAVYRGINKLQIEGFDEACAVMIFYQVGEFFQELAVSKSRKSISDLMDLKSNYANLKLGNEIKKVKPEEIKINDIIIVKPGEKIPLDGIIVKGDTVIDTKSLTGESIPKNVYVNDEVISGCVNLSSLIEVKVLKEFNDSTVSKILEMVENASMYKSKTENFISKFALYYTPCVVIFALLLVLIPGFLSNDWNMWIYRALNFLVVSCPCALVISVPLTFFSAIGVSSKLGVLIKGSNFIEKINKSNIFVFDKTGTLTKGEFKVVQVNPYNKKDEILHYASIAEKNSNHPIAKSIFKEYGKEVLDNYSINDISGKGIVASNNGDIILCGNDLLMEDYNIQYEKEDTLGTVVYVAFNNKFIGSIIIDDVVKEEAKDVINALNNCDYKTIMLSGDNENVAFRIANDIGISGYKANLLPQDKVQKLDDIIKAKTEKDVIVFIGDGINDAPVLVRSDVGISMGISGSDAAIEASDVVLMKDDLRGILFIKEVAKKTINIVYENIVFSLLIKFIILILSAFGITNMWFAVFGDVGVAIIAILNALRVNQIYRKYNKQKNPQ